jgi:hypothetical protein
MMDQTKKRYTPAIWGLAGVVLLLGSAVYRLTPIALEALASDLQSRHWIGLALVLFFMAYAEGYRAFQLGFSPRVAARARYLMTHKEMPHAVLAPLFCMAYFHAVKRRRIVSLSVTAGIIVLIVLVRLLPQPWRGIVDAGVVVGLAWGLVSLLIFGFQALFSDSFPFSPEVPEERKG